MGKFDYVLFDLDGTLTASAEGITKSVAYAIERAGRPPLSDTQLTEFIGPPLVPMFIDVCGMSEGEARQALEYYRERYSDVGWAEARVYTGIAPLLRALKRAGKFVAIATGKPEDAARQIAEHFGLLPHLDAVCGTPMHARAADKAELIAQALPPGADRARAVMVGDRRFDIEGARAAGISSIAAAYGYGAREELEAAGADTFAEAPDDLFALLDVPRPRGRFWTFEGADGCGKSTQHRMLAAWLLSRGHDVVVTREPGGCPISERIRALVLDAGADGMTNECEALLFAASRAQHVHDVILPALKAGKIVLCDRFLDSSIAYQAHGRELGEPFVRQINAVADRARPDRTLLYVLDTETSRARMLGAGIPDRIEVEDGDYYRRVADAYIALQQADTARIRAIDADGTIDDVFRRTLALAKDFPQEE